MYGFNQTFFLNDLYATVNTEHQIMTCKPHDMKKEKCRQRKENTHRLQFEKTHTIKLSEDKKCKYYYCSRFSQ